MNWKTKAWIQNTLAILPSGLSYDLYYFVQRRFGKLRVLTPRRRFQAGVQMADRIEAAGRSLEGAHVLEVGTGRCVNLPIALWLCGASRVTTVDLNPYLVPDLVFQSVGYVRENTAAVREIFGVHARRPVFQDRLQRLVDARPGDLPGLLSLCGIEYESPADAAALSQPDGAFDFHVSFTVLEHISPEVLSAILAEGKRVLKKGGLFVHCIDFSDHFAHSDRSVSTVNFLQFSEEEWARYAGNRYMYHNRLRADEFLGLLAVLGLHVQVYDTAVDARAMSALDGGLPLDPRFREKPREVNATSNAWVVASAATPPVLS